MKMSDFYLAELKALFSKTPKSFYKDEYPVIEVKHKNGYSGKLYGKSSMSIYDPNGRECLHTGFRNINSKEELEKELEDMPSFMGKLALLVNEDYLDDEDDI